MKAPALAAVMERRILVNYRVDPDLLDERARYQLDYVNPHDLVRIANPN